MLEFHFKLSKICVKSLQRDKHRKRKPEKVPRRFKVMWEKGQRTHFATDTDKLVTYKTRNLSWKKIPNS